MSIDDGMGRAYPDPPEAGLCARCARPHVGGEDACNCREKAEMQAEYTREQLFGETAVAALLGLAVQADEADEWPEGEGRCAGCGEVISHKHARCGECLADAADNHPANDPCAP